MFIETRRNYFLTRLPPIAAHLENREFSRIFDIAQLVSFCNSPARDRTNRTQNRELALMALKLVAVQRWLQYREIMVSWLLAYKDDPKLFDRFTTEQLLQGDHIIRPEVKQQEIEHPVVPHTGLFKCSKCGSRQTTYSSVQTRSADEPMTQFVFCHTCKHAFRR